jgi:hypothetical protein
MNCKVDNMVNIDKVMCFVLSDDSMEEEALAWTL